MAEQADVKEKLFGITSRNVKAEGENISAQTHNQIVEIAPPSTTLSRAQRKRKRELNGKCKYKMISYRVVWSVCRDTLYTQDH